MHKTLIIFILVNLFSLHLANAQFHAGEIKVNKKKISKQIIEYVEKHYDGHKVKYFKFITDDDSTFYEAKINKNEGDLYLIFDSNNQFVRIETQVDYHRDVPKELRKKVSTILEEKVSSHKVTYCKHQKTGNEDIYELDVSVKKKVYRFRFNEDGTLIDYKEIPQKSIDLIFN